MSGILQQKKKAVIDIGTNSIKLCIAGDLNVPDGYSVIRDEIEITRLGEGLSEHKELGEAPINRSIQTIQRFITIAHEMGAYETRAVGTAALRKALNADVFCTKAKDICGINIEIISGEYEAQLSYSAAVFFAHGQDSIVFDIGGGSIEIIYSNNGEISGRFSLDFGVLNIKEKYFLHEPVENNAISKACLEIANNLRGGGVVIPESNSLIIGIGGTITTMASVKLKLSKYMSNKVNGSVLDMNDIETQIRQYQNSTSEERSKIPGLSADRADIILSGACIVKTIMNSFSAEKVIVSANGLRHAILAEMFKN